MSLKNKKVAICGTRRVQEAVEGIERLGGMPFVENWVRMTFLTFEEVFEGLKNAIEEEPELFYFTTGEGLKVLFETAEKGKLFNELSSFLERGEVFVRGYKARAEMIHHGFKNFRSVENTEALIKALEDTPLAGKKLLVQMYGKEMPQLEEFLKERSARMLKIWVYKYEVLQESLDAFIKRLLRGFYGAVLFTSAYQVEYLFERAKELNLSKKLCKALNKDTIAIAVGQKTARSLFERGVLRVLYPEKERLTLAIKELERIFSHG